MRGTHRTRWDLKLLRVAFLFRHLWDRRSNRSVGLGDGARAEFYIEIWRCAADQLSAEFIALPDGFCEVRLGNRVTRMWEQYVMLDDPVTLKIAGDKPLVHTFLSQKDLAVPRYCEFRLDTIEKALAFLRNEGRACVVKPAVGTGGGAGVTTRVRTQRDLKRAAIYASLFSPRLLIEQQVPGDAYRLLYLGGQLLDAVRRRSPRVIGDGHSSIRELIAVENKRRAMEGCKAALSLLSIDLDCHATLRSAGLSLDTVPEKGVEVLVKTVSNQNGDMENESVRSLIGDALMREGARATEVLGVRLAGVDVITKDPSVSLKQSGGVINEVNTTPGLHFHYQVCNPERAVPVAVPILSLLLEIDHKKRIHRP